MILIRKGKLVFSLLKTSYKETMGNQRIETEKKQQDNKGKILIYGAGTIGEECLNYLKWRNLDAYCIAFVDRNYLELKKIGREEELGKKIYSVEEAYSMPYAIVIALGDAREEKKVLDIFYRKGKEVYGKDEIYKAICEKRTDHIRYYLAYVHAKFNDEYFTSAEDESSLEIFWGYETPFFKMFSNLDLANTVELACGWGRHVPKYYEKAGHITLVDILQENIEKCKKRFGSDSKISYYQNNGYNFENLKSSEYTSVFSYDAMVHFEMFDVFEYLCDTARILRRGGLALFHHSNNGSTPEMDFHETEHARNYMTKDLFRYLASRAGLSIVEQKTIDWYDNKSLDCISLLRKD